MPLRGRTRGLTRKTWIAYFGKERLGIPERVINRVEKELAAAIPTWHEYIDWSFLPAEQKGVYRALLDRRLAVLGLDRPGAS